MSPVSLLSIYRRAEGKCPLAFSWPWVSPGADMDTLFPAELIHLSVSPSWGTAWGTLGGGLG